MKRCTGLFIAAALAVISISTMAAGASRSTEPAAPPLPVKVPDLPSHDRTPWQQITLRQIHNIIGPDPAGKGLMIDLEDSTLFGEIYTGPYPFEAGSADFDYVRYRRWSRLRNGRGVLRIAGFFNPRYNANNWPEGQGWTMTPTIAYRLDLWRRNGGGAERLGFYQGLVSFERRDGKFVQINTITAGPFVSLVNSGDPTSLLISWTTSESSLGTVTLDDGQGRVTTFTEATAGTDHEIRVGHLRPQSRYAYHVTCATAAGDTTVSNRYTLETAPEAGEGRAVIAFGGDSRAGVGGGERSCMGVNTRILNWMSRDAHRRGADLLLFGGDLVNGYTTDTEEFELQLSAWKQAVSGFWRFHPIYPGMGNHEALLNGFDDGSRYGVTLDKWPYATASTEAIFAAMFYNPVNGPEPADPRRPPYRENVYSFQYGPVMIISFNNNYWWTSNRRIPEFGGSPEGYIMADQMAWIEGELDAAQQDPTVRYILMYAQEPVFPCGGHTSDAMWWRGDNNIRAYVCNRQTGRVEPDGPGIIEVRNRLWEAVSGHDKVAAVLSADEHEYYRVLVDDRTPVGVFPADDHDGDGKLDGYSANPRFRYPTYFVTAGSVGAPFYNREQTPWAPDVFTSQNGYVLLRADDERISLEFITETGQVFDRIDDLLAVKRGR